LEMQSLASFESQFDRFVNRYGRTMATSDAGVRAFAAHGGKTILWHGVADGQFKKHWALAQQTNFFVFTRHRGCCIARAAMGHNLSISWSR
jgi:hypothetical protein